jgi:argininosuccinate lyase
MPQKKNPDMAELIRGKVGRTTGQASDKVIKFASAEDQKIISSAKRDKCTIVNEILCNVQSLLDFSAIYENSMDAVSDRDYIVETLHNISLTMVQDEPVEKASDKVIKFASAEDQKIISSAKRDKCTIYASKKEPRYG